VDQTGSGRNAFVQKRLIALGEQALINLRELSEITAHAVQAGGWPAQQRTFATVA
jgi:hypothetical protein